MKKMAEVRRHLFQGRDWGVSWLCEDSCGGCVHDASDILDTKALIVVPVSADYNTLDTAA